jgi:hypothetical protein
MHDSVHDGIRTTFAEGMDTCRRINDEQSQVENVAGGIY